MSITAAEVKKLRTQTGAGMMDCKNALVEANGDFEALDVAHLLGVKITGLRGWCNCHHGSYLENRPISQSLVNDRRPRLLHVTHH